MTMGIRTAPPIRLRCHARCTSCTCFRNRRAASGHTRAGQGPDPLAAQGGRRALRAALSRSRRTTMSDDDARVYDSTGNIFEDMGLADPAERLAKAELARVIRKIVRERGLT